MSIPSSPLPSSPERLLSALEKHLSCAAEILATEELFSPLPESWTLDLKGVDILCKEGVSIPFYEKVLNWLNGKAGRRLFFIEDQPQRLKAFVTHPKGVEALNDPRIKLFYLESPLQREPIAKQVARLATFKNLKILGDAWIKLIESFHIATHAITSDAADFGVRVFRHLKANSQQPLRALSTLKGSQQGKTAIICGAGPSLEINGHLLEKWKDQALLIAAGSAIHAIGVEPHLVVALDPHVPLLRKKFFAVPTCVQARVHPETFNHVTGELFYFPESHFSFEHWIHGEEERLDTGWTAGTAGVAIAAYLGCTSIILVGMDYCYRGQQKYAGQKKYENENPLVSFQDEQGKTVWTQRDWILATEWLAQFAIKHPHIACRNATVNGIAINGFSPISLDDVFAGQPSSLTSHIQAAPMMPFPTKRMNEWLASLQNCYRNGLDPIPEGEIAQELLLEPLWQVWAPLFERELMADAQPIPLAEKLAIQKRLFFNQVIQEHLHAAK